MPEKLLVAGGVAAGLSAASAAKRLKKDMEVIVFEKSEWISYGACSIPYFVSDIIKKPEDLVVIPPEKFEKERNIRIKLLHEVVEIDPEARTLKVKNLREDKDLVYSYDYLVIGTGALATRPPIPGSHLEKIFTLRTLTDGIAIKNTIHEESPSRAVIVGGGYIGLEMAEAFHERGLQVTIIEMLDHILGTMDDEICQEVEAELDHHGVKLYKSTTVKSFEGSNGKVSKVVTDSASIDTDMVLLSTGIKPNTKLAEKAGIKLGVAGAIQADGSMKTSIDGIFAAGDCADVFHRITGKKTYIPLGTTANKQGRVAGEVIGGRPSVFGGVVGTAVSKIFRLAVARTGLTQREAEKEGLDIATSVVKTRSRAHSYPGGSTITVKYVFDRASRRLLGAQMAGMEGVGVAKRIDVLAAALHAGMTVDDVAGFDLSYAPPYAPVWDPILVAANVAKKSIKK